MRTLKRMQEVKNDKSIYNRRPSIIFFAIIKTWLLIIITMIVFLKLLPFYMLPIYIIIMGTLQYHLNILGHDGLHFLLSSSKKTNDFICRFFLHGPQGAPLSMMRSSHLNHHRHLGTDSDSDKQYYGLEQFKDGPAYKRWIIMSFLGGMFVPIILKLKKSKQPHANKSAGRISHEKLLDYISIIATQAIIYLYIFHLTESIFGYLYAWILPLFSIMFGLNTLRSNLEHAKHHEHPDQPLLFSFRPSKIVKFFISPFNMNYHAEHHLAPAIPFYNLPLSSANHEGKVIKIYTCYTSRFKQVISFYDQMDKKYKASSNISTPNRP